MNCKNCGNQVKNDFKFCPYCGEQTAGNGYAPLQETDASYQINTVQEQPDYASDFYVSAPGEPEIDLASKVSPQDQYQYGYTQKHEYVGKSSTGQRVRVRKTVTVEKYAGNTNVRAIPVKTESRVANPFLEFAELLEPMPELIEEPSDRLIHFSEVPSEPQEDFQDDPGQEEFYDEEDSREPQADFAQPVDPPQPAIHKKAAPVAQDAGWQQNQTEAAKHAKAQDDLPDNEANPPYYVYYPDQSEISFREEEKPGQVAVPVRQTVEYKDTPAEDEIEVPVFQHKAQTIVDEADIPKYEFQFPEPLEEDSVREEDPMPQKQDQAKTRTKASGGTIFVRILWIIVVLLAAGCISLLVYLYLTDGFVLSNLFASIKSALFNSHPF